MTAPLLDAEPLIHGQTFEEMTVGSAFRTAWRTITESDMVMFRQLAGFTEPLFLDARHAGESGYAGTLVPGMLTFAYAEGLVLQTNVINGTGMAFMHTEVDWVAPVYVGDTISVIVEVTESRPSKSGGRGVVTTRNTVVNQRDETVVTYTPVRMIRGRDFAGR